MEHLAAAGAFAALPWRTAGSRQQGGTAPPWAGQRFFQKTVCEGCPAGNLATPFHL